MTSKGSLATKQRFTPMLHEMLWICRRYWWIAFSGMLPFLMLTFVGKYLEGNSPNSFSLIMDDSEVFMQVAAVLFGIFAAFCMFRFQLQFQLLLEQEQVHHLFHRQPSKQFCFLFEILE